MVSPTICLYPLYIRAATFVPPLCDHKTDKVTIEGPKEAESLPWSSDLAMDAMVAVKFWAFSKQLHKGRQAGRSLTSCWKEAGEDTHIAVVPEWMRRVRPLVTPLKMHTVVYIVYEFDDASASLVPPLCFLYPTNSIHQVIPVATTVPPFSDHSNHWATMAMAPPPLCLLCTTCCATIAVLVVQGMHKGRAAAVTQKHNFLGLGDHWASWWIFW